MLPLYATKTTQHHLRTRTNSIPYHDKTRVYITHVCLWGGASSVIGTTKEGGSQPCHGKFCHPKKVVCFIEARRVDLTVLYYPQSITSKIQDCLIIVGGDRTSGGRVKGGGGGCREERVLRDKKGRA